LHAKIPKDLKNAPEFDQAVIAFHDKSWKDEEELCLTLTQFTPEEWPSIYHSLMQLSLSNPFRTFMYCWLGLT
jgi:hypothetical protein